MCNSISGQIKLNQSNCNDYDSKGWDHLPDNLAPQPFPNHDHLLDCNSPCHLHSLMRSFVLLKKKKKSCSHFGNWKLVLQQFFS